VTSGDVTTLNFTLDIEDFDGFILNENEHKVQVTFTPVAAIGLVDIPISPFVETFKPLFDAKSLDNGIVCSNGVYNSNLVSAYGSVDLLTFLKTQSASADPALGFRCNDMSLPFGGTFYLSSSWKHDDHEYGNNADIRYFNTSDSAQDAYDSGNAAQRIADVTAYLTFASDAKIIADAENTGTSDETLAKIAINNFCVSNPSVTPCDQVSAISDITREIILKLCQWNESSPGVKLSVCPNSLDLAGIKRYSNWIFKNYQGLNHIQQYVQKIIFSTGINIDEIVPAAKWQIMAINGGDWPNGDQVYKVGSGGTLENAQIQACFSANNCNLIENSVFDTTDLNDHIHHIHVEVK